MVGPSWPDTRRLPGPCKTLTWWRETIRLSGAREGLWTSHQKCRQTCRPLWGSRLCTAPMIPVIVVISNNMYTSYMVRVCLYTAYWLNACGHAFFWVKYWVQHSNVDTTICFYFNLVHYIKLPWFILLRLVLVEKEQLYLHSFVMIVF